MEHDVFIGVQVLVLRGLLDNHVLEEADLGVLVQRELQLLYSARSLEQLDRADMVGDHLRLRYVPEDLRCSILFALNDLP